MKKLFAKLFPAALMVFYCSIIFAYPVGTLDMNNASKINLGSTGVRMSTDGDGAITWLSLGNGFLEDITMNLDDTTNTGTFTSSTGLNVANFSGIALQESGNNVISSTEIDTSLELVNLVTDETGSGALVFGSAPSIASPSITGTVAGNATYSSVVLTTPTIGSFTNATHDHTNSAGGGQLSITGATTGTLTIARGGTSSTTATGSGSVVLATAPTINQLTATGGLDIVNSNATINSAAGTNITFSYNGSSQITFGTGAITPASDDVMDLGSGGNRWSAVWAVDGSINTSDERAKKEIEDSDLGLDFLNSLRPVSYRWKKRPKDLHYGLIAQELEKALNGKEFGGLKKPENDSEQYGLAYHELIGPMIKAIQELNAKVETLEAEKKMAGNCEVASHPQN